LRSVAVIPSRYAAQRFPGKPLHPIAGIPMIVRVLDQARKAKRIDAVIVATDDDRIARAVEDAGGRVVMTDPDLVSGTDRVWAAARDLDVEVVVNIQGDEPMMEPENIDLVAGFLLENPEFPLSTLALAIDDPDEIADPNNVKVVRADDGHALYFSRSPIPYRRRSAPDLPTWKHLGIYGYRKEALERWTSLPTHPLEWAESLEQLRAIAAGMRMAVLEAVGDSIGVDTPEDAQRVEKILTRARTTA
jgi:3-deoxy-manno-octulosonate cytidylyltransferase (CMP-KDO synthetase)